MTDNQTTIRPTGFYWVAGPDEPEMARWDADGCVWHFVGQEAAVDDAEVKVLRGPAAPPR